MVEDFVNGAEQRIGMQEAELLLVWIALVWNEMDGVTWDWFAYYFAFSHWYNTYIGSHSDSLGLDSSAESAAELYREFYVNKMRLFRREAKQWPGLSVSSWDRHVFDIARMKLDDGVYEEFSNLVAVVSPAVGAHHFQEFWRHLMTIMKPSGLMSVRSRVEKFVKREVSFPSRSLLAPADLPFAPYVPVIPG